MCRVLGCSDLLTCSTGLALLFYMWKGCACLWSHLCMSSTCVLLIHTAHAEATATILRSVGELRRVFHSSKRLQQELKKEVCCVALLWFVLYMHIYAVCALRSSV